MTHHKMHIASTVPSGLYHLAAKYQHMIESIEDERDMNDGYWVYLKPGYVFDSSTSFIHESNISAISKAFTQVHHYSDTNEA